MVCEMRYWPSGTRSSRAREVAASLMACWSVAVSSPTASPWRLGYLSLVKTTAEAVVGFGGVVRSGGQGKRESERNGNLGNATNHGAALPDVGV